jgi:uncharacterized membrane protein
MTPSGKPEHRFRSTEKQLGSTGEPALQGDGKTWDFLAGLPSRSELVDLLESHDRSDLTDRRLPPVFSLPGSAPGVAAGSLFVVLSLLPSMLPKSSIAQGVVLGVTFMVGYGLGTLWQWMLHFLELPSPKGRVWRIVVRCWYVSLAFLLISSLWRHVGWQNAVRDRFVMEGVSPFVWLLIIPVAVAVGTLILIVARSLRKLFYAIVRWFDRHLPRRLALLLGGVAFSLILWGFWSEVLVDGFFAVANQISAPLDEATDEGITEPQSALRSGSPASLVDWETLGRQGRKFAATGPTVDELNMFHGGGALEPIRVYVGLRSADSVEARAQLVLDELIRTRAFDRAVLVVATTTGTGKIDSNAVDALDYVTNGNVAVAGVQYSYLPSAVSLLGDADEVKETARVVFDTIHGYWSALPTANRPEFYVYGLSLGAYGVESILTSIDIINAPIDGALMVGPPFFNPLWNRLVADRDPYSTPIAPVYEEGRTVRFINETSAVSQPTREWGETRILYLQHASDPVVYFTPDLLLAQPAWLYEDQRSAELSDDFVWIPFVTMWQVLTDMTAAGSVPDGFGHLYSLQAHADAWIAVTDPDDWTRADSWRLHQHLVDLEAAG